MHYDIIITDDHPLYRAALRGAVLAGYPHAAVREAGSVAGLFELLEEQSAADLLLLDLNMPGAHGFSALAHLRGAFPQVPVVVISAMDDAATVRQAIAFGAQGFLSKSSDTAQIAAGLGRVLAGELAVPPGVALGHGAGAEPAAMELAQRLAELTPQQFRVYGLLCSGRLNKQIAYELQIAAATVKAHMTAILRKLGAGNRTQAVLLASRLAIDPSALRAPPEEID